MLLPTPPRRKAVICGVTYRGKDYGMELEGCANDARFMKHLLLSRYGFMESDMFLLTEDIPNHRGHYGMPTKAKIEEALQWLVHGCQSGDSLVFHFSGHGYQQPDNDGDEQDGMDEYIVPLDYDTAGIILDDYINRLIVNVLPHGVKLHAIIDACHSGTVLDLPCLCRMNRDGLYRWDDQRAQNGTRKGTSGGEAICFSACADYQKAAERPQGKDAIPTGVLTFGFVEAIERGNATTYGSLLRAMREHIQSRGDSEPQLSSSEPFDIDRKGFYL